MGGPSLLQFAFGHVGQPVDQETSNHGQEGRSQPHLIAAILQWQTDSNQNHHMLHKPMLILAL